jgi:hypothetical protein
MILYTSSYIYVPDIYPAHLYTPYIYIYIPDIFTPYIYIYIPFIRYSDFAAEFSAACYRAIEAGKAGHWQGELQRHEATLYRYSVPLTGFSSPSYFDAHKEALGAEDRPKQLSGNDYQCSYGCGFYGLYHVVAKHELTCPQCPAAP